MFIELRNNGRGAAVGRAALDVITREGPPGAIDAFQLARVPELVPELITKVDWRTGSPELQLVDGAWLRLGAWVGEVNARIEPFDAIELELGPLWVVKNEP